MLRQLLVGVAATARSIRDIDLAPPAGSRLKAALDQEINRSVVLWGITPSVCVFVVSDVAAGKRR